MKINEALQEMKQVREDDCCSPCVGGSSKKKKVKEYPWSMDINLQNKDLEILDIDVSEMETGDKLVLVAVAEVVSLESRKRDGEERQSMTIQMQQMSVKPKTKITMKEAM